MIIDMHTHVLPHMDDGSASMEETIGLLQLEAQQGISSVVATSHFYAHHDSPERFLEQRAESFAQLQNVLKMHKDLPNVILGAEIYYFSGMSNTDALKALTIDQKRCILLEMPQPPWTDRMYRELLDIREKLDLIPVIAHVDRYIGRFRTFGIPEKLESLPVLVQANASFFLNKATASMAMRMLRNNQVHLLGSDCHNLTSRKPRLGEAVAAIERSLGPEALAQIEDYQKVIFED